MIVGVRPVAVQSTCSSDLATHLQGRPATDTAPDRLGASRGQTRDVEPEGP